MVTPHVEIILLCANCIAFHHCAYPCHWCSSLPSTYATAISPRGSFIGLYAVRAPPQNYISPNRMKVFSNAIIPFPRFVNAKGAR